jgi:spermidine synthase
LSSQSYGKKVGLIGMGAGTLALYGRAGDVYRFYEIDPAVIEIAHDEFSFIANSRAHVDTVLGDARLSLEREPSNNFDVLAVDAFSGDSIPIHLITAEAMGVYMKHMNPDGIIAFHVTNRFLWLPPEVARIAAAKGLYSVLVHDENDNPALRNTDWVLVAANPLVLEREAIRHAATPIKLERKALAWTDDFNNLFNALK